MNTAGQIAFLQSVGVLPSDEEIARTQDEEESATPEFDGGVRESVPLPSDPMADHNREMIEMLYSMPPRGWGGGEL